MPKKLKGDPLGFFNIYSVAKQQKMKGDSLGKKIFLEKSRSAEKNNIVFPEKNQKINHKYNKPGPAPYQRLKNSKRTSKCQSILFYSTRNFFRKSHNAEKN